MEKNFQYGWKSFSDCGLKRANADYLSNTEIQSIFDESISNIKNPCFVGHNFIQWDYPILLKNDISFLSPCVYGIHY